VPRATSPAGVGLSDHLSVRRSGMEVQYLLISGKFFSLMTCIKSAFVGCASIILLLPAPGYFAAKLQTVQRKKMTVVSHIFLHFPPPVLSNSWK
jgi:hypothetical protein